jgi:hypothetical protein
MFNSGTCRGTILPTVSSTFAANCADNFLGGGLGSINSYVIGSTSASMSASWAMPNSVPIAPGTEYYGVNIFISNIRTVGTASCPGCLQPVCIVLNDVDLIYGPSAAPLIQSITAPLNRNRITWQGGAISGGCPGAVPTRNQTWGQIKSLYR